MSQALLDQASDLGKLGGVRFTLSRVLFRVALSQGRQLLFEVIGGRLCPFDMFANAIFAIGEAVQTGWTSATVVLTREAHVPDFVLSEVITLTKAEIENFVTVVQVDDS